MQINNCTRDLNIYSNSIVKNKSALSNQSSIFTTKNKNAKNKNANVSDKLKEIVNQKQEMEKDYKKMKENRENYINELKGRIEEACNQFTNLADKIDSADDELDALKGGKINAEGDGISKKDILKSLEELNELIANSRIELENYTKSSAKEIEEMQKSMNNLNNDIKDDSKYNLNEGFFVDQYKQRLKSIKER